MVINNPESKYKKIKNLTSHSPFKEFSSGLSIDTEPNSLVRVDTKEEIIYRDPSGFCIKKIIYGNIIGLDLDNIDPECLYIVSAVVLNALQSKGYYFENIVAPDKSVRDGHSNVIGSTHFRING